MSLGEASVVKAFLRDCIEAISQRRKSEYQNLEIILAEQCEDRTWE